MMAESAVVTHLDRRAAGLLADHGVPAGARATSRVRARRARPPRPRAPPDPFTPGALCALGVLRSR
ncbi:hypothetical protein [Streptomyces virginiae]|uniref:hypothetical protein n=1 Tax=Streptomyces virginiae TaxID=1961 RepID=UPI00367C8CBC